MTTVNLHNDPLLHGFYTIRDATRYLKINSRVKIRSWLTSHSTSNVNPIIKRSHALLGNQQEISFLDLMEIRFIEHYRQKNIPLQTLRVAAQHARDELKTSHPFALIGVKFMHERKKIFLQTADELGDIRLFNLITKQFELYEVIEQILEKGVSFDKKTGVAEQWHPEQNLAPNVYLNPRFALGQPVIGKNAIATGAIFRTYQAEKGNIDKVAKWYGIPSGLVSEAITFEASLAA